MPGPELPETPAPLKSIQPYLKTANEHDARDVVVSYWCRLYALQTGLKLSTKTSEETNFLLKLMDWLEGTKKSNHENEAITNEVAAQAHLENWALKLFLYADKNDRASNFGKNVVQSFYTAGLLYDVLTTFGELSEEASQNRKYAKWKAAYIHNCLKNGQTPVPGPAKEEDDDNSNENVGSNLMDFDDDNNADHENKEDNDPGMQPSQPTLPMQPPMMPTLPTQPTPPTTMGAYDFPSVPAKDKDNEDSENNEGNENNEGVENNEDVENNEESAETDETKDDVNNDEINESVENNDTTNENNENDENNETIYENDKNDENNESNENDENNENNEEAAENEENQGDGKDEKPEPHPYNPAPTPTNPGTNNRVSYDDKSSSLKSEAGVELTVEQSGKAQKYIKWAGSALNYDDVPTAILNLRKALHLLTTGEDPA